MRKSVVFALLAAWFGGMGVVQSAKAADPAKKLNVLVIYVDDLNNRLACYGDPVVKTPNIDKLAARGVLFNRAYCQYPVCNASRSSLLSGRYPQTTGIWGNSTPSRTYLGNDFRFLPEYFHDQGYFTAKAGKIIHMTFDRQVSWDINGDLGQAQQDEDTTHPLSGDDKAADDKSGEGKGGEAKPAEGKGKAGAVRAGKGKGNVVSDEVRAKRKAAREAKAEPGATDVTKMPASVEWKALDVTDDHTMDGSSARKVVTYLNEHHDKPFFMACGFHKPHRPYQAPKPYFNDYPSDQQKLALQSPTGREGVPPMAFTNIPEDRYLTDKQQKDAIAAYHACITFMDAQAGLLLDTMDKLKLWDNTVVIFMSDHGYHLGEHEKLWRKMTLFEEAARVPFIIAAPGMKPGVCERPVEVLSVFPTLVDLCKLPQPQGLEGVSITPLLKDPKAAWDRPAFTVVSRGKEGTGWSLRTEQWRYAEWGAKKEAELYDVKGDTHEFHNLANDPKYADVVKDLSAKLRAKWPDHNTGETPKGGDAGGN